MNSLAKLHIIMMCMEKFEFWKILLVLIVHTFVYVCVCVHVHTYVLIYTYTYLCSVLPVCTSVQIVIQLHS